MLRASFTAAVLASVAACSAGGPSDSDAGSNGGTGNGNGGSGSGSNSGGTGGSVNPGEVCGASQLATAKLRRLTKAEFENTLNDVFPTVKGAWSSVLQADPVSHLGFDNDASLLVVGKQTADQLDRTAEAVGNVVSGAALATLLPCSASAADQACAQQFVEQYGKRLFRRPLTTDEVTRYLGLFQTVSAGSTFANGIAYVTRGLIQSPHAVYRSEVGSASGADTALTQYEIATELAYTFSGTTPTEALLQQADQGQLNSPEALVTAAKALLATEGGQQAIHKFFNTWLGYGKVSAIDRAAVQDFKQYRDQMAAETRSFIQDVVITNGGGLKELLTATFTTPSTSLASFYGFPAPSTDYGRVERPTGRGIGILSQGSLLAGYANSDGSSPTKRGILVFEKLLCGEKPAVPANVPLLPAPAPGQYTTRQRYEQNHASVQPCKGCHALFDPIGFGFEHYDEVGRYRENEGGLPIDSASVLPNTEPAVAFSGQEELATALAARSEAYECSTGMLTSYAFGSGESCLGETRRGEFITQQIGFVEYLASLAAEPSFRQRRVE